MIAAGRRCQARTAGARRWALLLWLLLALVPGAPAVAAQTPAPTATAGVPAGPPAVSAAAWILVDLTNNRIIASREPHARLAVASLTKVMTAVVALRYGAPGDEVTVESRDLPGEASIGLKPGERLPLETLLYGMLLRSGNDAAAVIARGVGAKVAAERGLATDGVALFLDLMNEQAASLGMSNTHFRNPHGLDAPSHYSSAYDLALLTSHALREPAFVRMFGARSYPFRGGVWTNVNRLLYEYEGIIGGKTGVENQAGLCLIEVAERADRRLAVVVLNAPQWYNDARALLDYGFGEARGLPAGSLAPFGAPSPATGPPPTARATAPAAPRPAAQAALAAEATPTAPPLLTPIAPAAGTRPAEVRRGSGGDVVGLESQPLAVQAAEPDWSTLLLVATVAGAVVLAAALVGLILRALRLGPFAGGRWGPAGRSGRPAPWRTYEMEAPAARGGGPPRPRPAPASRGVPRPEDHPAAPSAEDGPAAPGAGPVPTDRVLDHLTVALRHLAAGRHDTAESFFVKAIQIAPDFRFSTVPEFWAMPADGYVALALAYRRCNRAAQARAVVVLGLVRYPEHPDLRSLDRQLRADRREP
jgi:D-alanyl-D-alanine carboxypeptidase